MGAVGRAVVGPGEWGGRESQPRWPGDRGHTEPTVAAQRKRGRKEGPGEPKRARLVAGQGVGFRLLGDLQAAPGLSCTAMQAEGSSEAPVGAPCTEEGPRSAGLGRSLEVTKWGHRRAAGRLAGGRGEVLTLELEGPWAGDPRPPPPQPGEPEARPDFELIRQGETGAGEAHPQGGLPKGSVLPQAGLRATQGPSLAPPPGNLRWLRGTRVQYREVVLARSAGSGGSRLLGSYSSSGPPARRAGQCGRGPQGPAAPWGSLASGSGSAPNTSDVV